MSDAAFSSRFKEKSAHTIRSSLQLVKMSQLPLTRSERNFERIVGATGMPPRDVLEVFLGAHR